MILDQKFKIHQNRNDVNNCYHCRLIFVSGAVANCDNQNLFDVIYHSYLPIYMEFDNKILFYYDFFTFHLEDKCQQFFNEQDFTRNNNLYFKECYPDNVDYYKDFKYLNFDYEFSVYDYDSDLDEDDVNFHRHAEIDHQLIKHFRHKHPYYFLPEFHLNNDVKFINLKKYIKSSDFIKNIRAYFLQNPNSCFITKQISTKEVDDTFAPTITKMDTRLTVVHCFVSFLEDCA